MSSSGTRGLSRAWSLIVSLAPPFHPGHEPVPVVIERDGHGGDHGREHRDFEIVTRGRLRALSGEHQGPGHPPERRHDGEDPEGHGRETEEIADDILGQPRDQEDDEADDGALGLHDEAELLPRLFLDEVLDVVGAQPPPEGEGYERADREPDGLVQEPQPLAEEKAAEDARGLAGNGRDDDLQGLECDEEDGRENSPLRERLLEELLVDVEANEVLVGGGVGPHEPDAVPDDGRAHQRREGPAGAGGQSRAPVTRVMPRPFPSPADRDRSARPSHSVATSEAAWAAAPPPAPA